MCKFVKITCVTNKAVSYLNMDIITEMYEDTKGTRLYFGSPDNYITVEETPGQIIHQIQRSKQ